jgi:light-regulated signal transduction histidine kinase (bacteriophytochrome)
LAGGNLEQQVRVGGPGELRELAEAFNSMARRIGAAHHELEGKVAERTAALWRYATDLEAANREMEAFSYSVSHDLRAPLRAIHGFSQALLEDSRDRLDAEGKDHLRRVCAAADRMGLLIDDLLELSRVARTEMRAEPVDLSQLAHRVTTELRQGQPARAVEVRIADGLSATGDHRLIRLLLQNLLDNAWKFTSKQPRAHIEVGVGNGADPAFFVRDNGAGFDMAYGDKLFGVFQRLHAVSEFPGTGVGLAIVQRVVHRHGGRVWADAAPGRGATFYFTLPGAEVRSAEAEWKTA